MSRNAQDPARLLLAVIARHVDGGPSVAYEILEVIICTKSHRTALDTHRSPVGEFFIQVMMDTFRQPHLFAPNSS
jgi:hypothetical protein